MLHRVSTNFHGSRSLATLVKSKMSPSTINAQYAVRGELVIRATQIRDALAKGDKYPFDKVIMCNIGNPQSLGQNPITFFRQVLAACNYPALLNEGTLPQDARDRALQILNNTDNFSIGAYTHSQGLQVLREDVASFLLKRDGYAANTSDIFLTDGASPGIKTVLQIMISNSNVGVMIPIPQYPLYSASITLCGGAQVPYFLNEEAGWGLDLASLQQAYRKATEQGVDVRALCVINPGNPTGQCLTIENQQAIIRFARDNGIAILADEVYQQNVYSSSSSFHSFRKVLLDMGAEAQGVELISFHSTSKGVLGECGLRGGFMHLTNIDAFAHEMLYKLASISLCPNVCGQIMTGLMARPPQAGEPSYEVYHAEATAQFESLKRRAHKATQVLNSVPGIRCQEVQGAMYAFPEIDIPAKAVAKATALGRAPDVFFALELLANTGVCVVPGSGFGQKDGTYHFRTTILPPESEMAVVLNRIVDFYTKFAEMHA